MIIKDINKLNLKTKEKALKLFDLAKKKGIILELNETIRDYPTQMLYYLQGRIDSDDYAELNEVRKYFGFWDLTKEEAFRKITKTLKSKHITGKAFDVVVIKNGKRCYDEAALKQVGAIAPSVGLLWGGTFGDMPHFEDIE